MFNYSDAQKFIANLIKPITTPTTIRKISEAVQDGLGEMYSIHIVKSWKRHWGIISKSLDRDNSNTSITESRLLKDYSALSYIKWFSLNSQY